MKLDLQAKFLQHLNKKKQEEGFTLIELLVVIIIIGILAAIALPSFLNQANKGKQSEAKTYLGSVNKAQQANFTEFNEFSSSIVDLGVGIKTQTANYKYGASVTGTGTGSVAIGASSLTTAGSVLKNYAGYVSLIASGGTSGDFTSVAILCEEKKGGNGVTISGGTGTTCSSSQVQVGK